MSGNPIMCDVLIIGGGYSGLSAASYLFKHSMENFILLEARDRVGGRTYTIEVPHDPSDPSQGTHSIDLGGAYVGPTQNRLLRKIKEFGLKTVRVHHKNKFVIQYNQTSHIQQKEGKECPVPQNLEISPFQITHETTVPFNLPILSLLDINYLLNETHRLSTLIDNKSPWNSERNSSALSSSSSIPLDEMTVSEWINLHGQTPIGKEMYKMTVSGILCVECHEVSMLYWLFYVSAGKGLLRLVETDKGAQERKVVGGTSQICRLMAESVGGEKRVKMGRAVDKIQWGGGGGEEKSENSSHPIKVTCRNGEMYMAKTLIVAVSPSLYNSLNFTPTLPSPKCIAAKRMFMGTIIKTIMQFPTPYWRKNGFNGIVLNNMGPINYSYDDCHHVSGDSVYAGPEDKQWEKINSKFMNEKPFYGIMGFVLGETGRQWMKLSAEERKFAIAAQYAAAFGKPDGSDASERIPIGYWELNWDAEEFSKGCYVGVMPPGVLTTLREDLRNPLGEDIYFGGTELATQHVGYIDGAIQTGERVAHQILQKKGIVREDFNEECPDDLLSDVVNVPMEPSWGERILPRPNTMKKVIYGVLWVSIAAAWGYATTYLENKGKS